MEKIYLEILLEDTCNCKECKANSAKELAELNREWTAWVMKHAYYNHVTKLYKRIPTENYGTKKYTIDDLFNYWINEVRTK